MTKAVLFVRLGQIVDTDVRRSIVEFDKLFKAFEITIDWEDPGLFVAANKLFEKFNSGGYYASESVLRMAKHIQQRNKQNRHSPALDLDALARNAFASEFFALLKAQLPADIAPEKLQALKEAWDKGWLSAWNAQCNVDLNCLHLAARIVALNTEPKSRISVVIVGGTNSAHVQKIVLSLLSAEIDLTKVTTLFTFRARSTVPDMLAKFLDANAGKYIFFQTPGNPSLVQHPAFAAIARENERKIQAITRAHGVTNIPLDGKLTPIILSQVINQITDDPRFKAVGSSPAFTDMTPYPRPSDFGI